MNGFLNIDKPAGMTSTDVVRRVRRLAGQKRVGHGGTLDPLATGVLPIALGLATRLLEYMLEEEGKSYLATVQLGSTTDTDDAEGAIIATAPVPPLDLATLEATLQPFRGTITQIPPRYAAIRVDGRRLYEYARAGEVVAIPARTVTIEQLDLLEWTADTLVIQVACSKGTYIRSLARDLGASLGCGAHLTALRRTQAGVFDLATAVPLADLLDNPDRLASALLPPTAALAGWPQITVDEAGIQLLRQGQRIPAAGPDERAAILDAAGELVAIVVRQAGQWQPTKVF
ncbi:MAG: tRNA pseudouridine(55) synthase TruB [Herpetosiphonaceae bacterium]|nr:tRNA pseudouridine(55) synthase TruB [Herpetosiphonaceae bacterium]